MKKIIIFVGLFLFTNSVFAICSMEGAGCYANPETCGGAYCTTTYSYDPGHCVCTDYCVCESPPPGVDINDCLCPAEPGGQAVACE